MGEQDLDPIVIFRRARYLSNTNLEEDVNNIVNALDLSSNLKSDMMNISLDILCGLAQKLITPSVYKPEVKGVGISVVRLEGKEVYFEIRESPMKKNELRCVLFLMDYVNQANSEIHHFGKYGDYCSLIEKADSFFRMALE
jgi:hypothetical protein